jgi:phosphate starvation-inducible membrane PsiE
MVIGFSFSVRTACLNIINLLITISSIIIGCCGHCLIQYSFAGTVLDRQVYHVQQMQYWQYSSTSDILSKWNIILLESLGLIFIYYESKSLQFSLGHGSLKYFSFFSVLNYKPQLTEQP